MLTFSSDVSEAKTATRAPRQLLIGQLAAAVGVKSDTVRFYEKTGLLPRPKRTTSGYRVFDEASLRQLRFIRKAQALGFSLEEVRRILALRRANSGACQSVLAIAEATLEETERKLRDLIRFRDSLATNVKRWRKLPRAKKCAAEFCDLIESSSEQS